MNYKRLTVIIINVVFIIMIIYGIYYYGTLVYGSDIPDVSDRDKNLMSIGVIVGIAIFEATSRLLKAVLKPKTT